MLCLNDFRKGDAPKWLLRGFLGVKTVVLVKFSKFDI